MEGEGCTLVTVCTLTYIQTQNKGGDLVAEKNKNKQASIKLKSNLRLTISDEVIRFAKAKAAREGRSLSVCVEVLLIKWINGGKSNGAS